MLASVEPDETRAFRALAYEPGYVFAFLCQRQDDDELKNSILAGWCLWKATRNRATTMGFDPDICGEFTLMRMLDQVLEEAVEAGDLIEAARR